MIEVRGWSLHQPWAGYVAHGLKKIETRGKGHPYRGPVAIHAAKVWSDEYAELFRQHLAAYTDTFREQWPNHPLPPAREIPRGAFLAVGMLTLCEVMTEGMIEAQNGLELMVGDWRPGRYAYFLEDVRRLMVPIPAQGKQGMWHLEEGPAEVLALAQAIDWDARYAVGQRVRYWPHGRPTGLRVQAQSAEKPHVMTKTRSGATVRGSMSVVWLEGHSHCVTLDCLEAVTS